MEKTISAATNNTQFSTTTRKEGVKKFGFVSNLRTCVDELNSILAEGQQVTTNELNGIVESAKVVYVNRYGYDRDSNGNPVSPQKATVLYFCTGRTSADGEPVIGWFDRKTVDARWQGVKWGVKADLIGKLRVDRMYRFGALCFDKEHEGRAFLEDVAASTIPETWAFKNRPSTVHHPVLRSYLEHIYEVLKIEAGKGIPNKLVYSADGRYVLFNTNLLDIFSHDVLVMGEVRKVGKETIVANPRRVLSGCELIKFGFKKNCHPEPPRFFEKVDEVIFQPSWEIDKNFDKFNHIVEERRDRFPEELRKLPSDALAKKLDDAINFAVAVAQRNYKFIVPMYRPQKGSIQLLMPIFLSGSYSSKPDFALVLTPQREGEYYMPETILPLEAGYQNARLIAKPDEAWLNPDTIQ